MCESTVGGTRSGGGGGGGSWLGRCASGSAHLLAYLALFVTIVPQHWLDLCPALLLCLSFAFGSLLRRRGGTGEVRRRPDRWMPFRSTGEDDATRRSQGRGRTSGVSFLSGGGAAFLFLGFFFGLGALGVLGSRAIATHRLPPSTGECFLSIPNYLLSRYMCEIDK